MTGANIGADEISHILEDLKASLEPAARLQKLSRLRVLGRNPSISKPIFASEGLETLRAIALPTVLDDEASSLEALRCLANALLLNPQARQTFNDKGTAPQLIQRYEAADLDTEFLCARLLLLLTYVDGASFVHTAQATRLVKSINTKVERHTANGDKSTLSTTALCETLKLLFNLVHFEQSHASECTLSIGNLLALVHHYTNSSQWLASSPLEPPINHLFSALMSLLDDNKSNQASDTYNPSVDSDKHQLATLRRKQLFPEEPQAENTDYDFTDDTLKLLLASLAAYPEDNLDQQISPLVLVLRSTHALAPPPVQAHMRKRLLPSDTERTQPLGATDTLPSKLLRASLSVYAPNLRESIPQLLFELCGSDRGAFVRAVGYGYASGFLVRRGLNAPTEAEAEAEVTGEATAGNRQGRNVDGRDGVNYTTGQYTSHEPADTGPPMTEEEKEREAERLFVLFERLRATGVVDVENPVAQAVRDGRFEELPDDHDDE